MTTVPPVAAASIHVRVLGPFVALVDGVPLAIRSRTQRRILAVLASHAPGPVTIDRLIQTVWGDEPPATVRASLQGHISDLRTALEPARAPRSEGTAIATEGEAYALRREAVDVDWLDFEESVVAARSAAGRQDTRGAVAAYRHAESLWRGEPFDGFADLVRDHATWLSVLRADARHERIELELRTGNVASLLPELESMVTHAPLDERTAMARMRALYRSGHRREAILEFQRIREALGDHAGLEPSQELRLLEAEILRDDPLLRRSLGLEPDPSSLSAGGSPLTALTGRSEEMHDALIAVTRHRLSSLVGPPGVGKTALATRIAEYAPDGSVVVDLSTLENDEHVAATVADTLGARDVPFQDPVDVVAGLLQGSLLILDGYDRVSAGAAALVTRLLRHDADVRVLATGRRPLGLVDEHRLDIGPLDPMAAEQLLRRRAGDALAPDAEVAGLIGRTGGLPLAIELAAPHLQAFTPAELVARLDDGDALERPGAGANDRHRSISAALRWGLEASNPAAVALFEVASVFQGPFGAADLERIADELGVEFSPAGVTELVASGLALVAQAEPRRYRILTPLATHGRERLESKGLLDQARDAHARELAFVMAQSADRLGGHQPDQARDELLRSFSDLRAALDWLAERGQVDDHLRAVGPLFMFWFVTGRLREGQREAERAVARSGGLPHLRLQALTTAAFLAWWQADYATVRAHIEEARGLVDEGVSSVEIALLDGSLAWAERRFDDTKRHLDVALEASEHLGDVLQRCMVLAMCGQTAWFFGDHETAWQHYRNCAETGARMGNAFIRGIALRGEALNLALAGHGERARGQVEVSLDLAERLGDPISRGQAVVFAQLTALSLEPGVPDRAVPSLTDGLATALRAGDMFCVLLGVGGLAELAHRLGLDATAVTLWSWVELVNSVTGLPLPQLEEARQARALEAARARLPALDYDEAASRGRSMSPDDLVAWAVDALA